MNNSEVNINENGSTDVNLSSFNAQTKEHMFGTSDKSKLYNASTLKPSHPSNISSKWSDTRTGSAKNMQIPNLSYTGNDR